MGDLSLADGTPRDGGTLSVPVPVADGHAPDTRRVLQLALAGLWLLDAVLQYQPSMFTSSFSRSLAGTAAGNPGPVAGPITWSAGLVAQHGATLNTVFATIQLLLAIGIAFRPTARVALGASVAWALGVWWLGEGLGGVLTGTASPLGGAPGAAILYGLLAVLLRPAASPADRASDSAADSPAPFIAARAVGQRAARILWLVLWLSLAYFALQPANRAAQAPHDMIAGMASGEPGWLAALERNAAALVGHQGLAASVVLAAALALVAVGVYLPPAAARGTLLLAVVVAGVIWVVGEAFGMILAGGSTDPNSGPLLILLAAAYWPARATARWPARAAARPAAGEGADEGADEGRAVA
jgi:hypothetical protein